MDIFGVISLLGGLALFLYGMVMLGESLENASGGRFELILERLTNNLASAVLLGTLTTALIQSSSATTVIVIGLINAGMLSLRRAIGIIMGANIGTTATAQLLRLSDIDASNAFLMFLKPTTLAPIAAVIGIVLYMGSRRTHTRNGGLILLGFSILFMGMFAMEQAVYPLRDIPEVADVFLTLSNPLLGVLTGTVVTAIIQSSSASVGILQALSSTGQITCSTAFPIIMGQNIGTCITAILAAIGATKNAKRAAAVHLSFNIFGTIFFLSATYAYQAFIGFDFWDKPIDRGGIADFHTLFNIGSTLLLLPFVSQLERLARAIVSDARGDAQPVQNILLEERLLASPVLALEQGRRVVSRLSWMTRLMLRLSITLFGRFHFRRVERVKSTHAFVEKNLVRLEDYILKLSNRALSAGDSLVSSELLNVIIESRHIMTNILSIMEYAVAMSESRAGFSAEARSELSRIAKAVGECLRLTSLSLSPEKESRFIAVMALNAVIAQLSDQLKDEHIDRLRRGDCSLESSFAFVGLLSDLRAVAQHCSNIAVMLRVMVSGTGKQIRREILDELRTEHNDAYERMLARYRDAYCSDQIRD